jgi:hypothetical protein
MLNPVNKRTMITGSLAALFLILSNWVFGYALIDKSKNNLVPDFKYDHSISKALAFGNAPGIVVSAVLALFATLYLLYLRNVTGWYYSLYGIITLLTALYISLIWVTPYNDPDFMKYGDQHYAIAMTAFTLILLFDFIVFYMLYKNYGYKWLFIILAFVNLVFFASIFIVQAIAEKSTDLLKIRQEDNYFSYAENINYSYIIIAIILLGYFVEDKKVKLKSKKMNKK